MSASWLGNLEYVPPAAMKRLLSGCIWEGTPDSGNMALTFDDGPDPAVTPAVIDALDAMGARGTFFLLGERVRRYPDIARLICERGHLIGSHTMTHSRLLLMRRAEIDAELDDAQREIANATGVEPTLFRPPHGMFDFTAARAVRERGFDMVLWTVLSGDYLDDAPDTVFRRVEPFIRPGAIAVFHDTEQGGGAALPDILHRIGAVAAGRNVGLRGLDELSFADEIELDEDRDE